MDGFLSFRRVIDGPWGAFERAVGRLLYHLGFDDVRFIGGSNDQGGDVLALRGGERWVFQVKFTGSAAVGEAAIREVLRAAVSYKADRTVVVTNNRATGGAMAYQNRLKAEEGVTVEIIDGDGVLRLFENCPPEPTSRFIPRDYQNEAADEVLTGLLRGTGKASFVLATGLGKTVVAAEVVARLYERYPEMRAVVVAHVKELVEQLETAFWRQLPKTVSTHLWTGDEKPAYAEGVTFATIESLYAQRERLRDGEFNLVVVDEAHHAGSASYQAVLKRLAAPLLLGMTATPWRGDGFDIDRIFGSPVFIMGIGEGLRRGFLAEVDYRMMVDDIDWEQVPHLSRMGLSLGELNRRLFLPQRDQAVLTQVESHFREMGSPRTIVFCRTIDHAEQVAGMINAAGFARAECLSSKKTRRERNVLMSNFRDGAYDVVTAVDVLNEGVDVPDVALIVFLRVTHSRRIFVQQLGRGLRLREGKTTVRVLDFVSDIRRLAAGLELQREYNQVDTGEVEVLTLPKRIVSFSQPGAETLIEQWIRDAANLQDADDKAKLNFPPI